MMKKSGSSVKHATNRRAFLTNGMVAAGAAILLLIGVGAVVLFGPWMLTRLISFTVTLFQSLPQYVR